MGMFDALRKRLKGFGQRVEEEVSRELPQPAKVPAPARPAAKPPEPEPEPEFDEELERELAEIEAEVEAERRGEVPRPVAEPAGPAAKPAPAPRAAKPAPRKEARQAPPKPPRPAAAAKPPAPAPAKGRGVGIRPERVEELLWDLELMLLESDIAVPVVEAIKERLQRSLPDLRVESTGQVQPAVEAALKEALRDVLSRHVMDFDEAVLNAKKPFRIMFVGVNGTGKTTTIARLAHRLKQNGYSSVLAAGDTFRAGAIEQISIHSDRLGLTVIKHSAGADPAAVAHDAIEHAKSRRKDVVLIDTAGRMQTNLNLMDEMKKIRRVAQPDMVVFVGDALAGNDAVEQAKKFDEAVGLDAAILTKVDTDSKGGAALSIAYAVGKPILFLGVGQGYEDLIPFDPDWVVSRIFGE